MFHRHLPGSQPWFPFCRRRCFRVPALIAAALLLAQPAAAQRRAIFGDDARRLEPAARAHPMVVRQRETDADLALLRDARATGGFAAPVPARSVLLNLFPDAEFTAVLDRVEPVSTLGYAWVGRIAGAEASLVVIGVAGGVMTASVELGQALYSVRPSTPGRYVVSQVEAVSMPPDAPSVDAPAGPMARGTSSDSGDTYDLLVLYTATARAAAGGTPNMHAALVASIARLNGVYAASDVRTRCRLVGAVETAYAETGAVGLDLVRIRADAQANSLRDFYGADVVSLVVSGDDAGYSGIAYRMAGNDASFAPWAFNVGVLEAAWSPTVGALPHLIGHNQGAGHEPGPGCKGAFPYSCGYTDTANGFATVMSLAGSCPSCLALPQFSNPAIRFKHVPTGSAMQDNARALNDSRATVANFRQAIDALAAPAGLTASASGSTVSLLWTAPPVGRVVDYLIEVGSAPGLANIAIFSTGSASPSFVAEGVGDGTYDVRVRASNGLSVGEPSPEIRVVVASAAPRSNGGQTVPGLGAAAGSTVTRPWACLAIPSGTLSVFSNVVTSPACEAASTSAVTLRLEPPTLGMAAPAVVPGAPTSLAASVAGRTVTLTWVAPGGAPVSYVLEAGSSPGLSDLANTDTGSSTPMLVATDVAPGLYYVRVRARNADGAGPVSNEIVVVVQGDCLGIPGPATGLTASTSGSSVVLMWRAPTSVCTPAYYVIEAGSAPGLSDLALFSTGSSATSFAANGVANGRYFIRIRSGTRAGLSGVSNEVSVTVGAPPCTHAPSPPLNFSATVSGTTVRLTWKAPDFGHPTSYVVEAGSAHSLTDIVVWDIGGPATTVTAEAGAGTYFVRLRALNNCGTSLPSVELVVSVTIGTPGPPIVTAHPASRTVAAGTPVTFAAAATGNPTPVVSWQSRPNSTPTWTTIEGARSTTYTRTASQADDGRQFRAVFVNGFGSAETNEASLTIVCAAPVAPVVTVQPSSGLYAVEQYVTVRSQATGCPVPAVQWQQSLDGGLNWSNVPGETTARWEFDMPSHDLQVRAVFTNVAGVAVSSVATLTVLRRPEILVQPQDLTVTAGTQVTFTASARCVAPMSGTWSTTGGVITNTVDGTTLTTTQTFTAQVSDNGRRYGVQFCPTPCWDLCCTSTRAATLTVTPAAAASTRLRAPDR